MDPTPIAEMKFEVALAELEATVASMENAQLELADSIAAHRRGMTFGLSAGGRHRLRSRIGRAQARRSLQGRRSACPFPSSSRCP